MKVWTFFFCPTMHKKIETPLCIVPQINEFTDTYPYSAASWIGVAWDLSRALSIDTPDLVVRIHSRHSVWPIAVWVSERKKKQSVLFCCVPPCLCTSPQGRRTRGGWGGSGRPTFSALFFFCRFSQAKKKNKNWRDDTLITQRVSLNKGSMIAFIAIVLCRSAAAMPWLG